MKLDISKIIARVTKKILPYYTYLQSRPDVRNASLAGFNLFLLLFLVLQYNVLGIFAVGYEGADVLLDLEQEDVQSIHIDDPDFRGLTIQLVRKEELPLGQWASAKPSAATETSLFSSIYNYRPTQYSWQLKVSGKKTKKTAAKLSSEIDQQQEQENIKRYLADVERVAEFFAALQDVRTYYSLPHTQEREKSLGMQTNSQGSYAGLRVQFKLSNGDNHSLYFGRTSKDGRESYVRLDDQGQIYVIRADLRTKSGSGDVDYFRNRLLLPYTVSSGEVVSLIAKKASNLSPITHLVYNGKEWSMQYPLASGKVRSEAVQSFVKDMLAWKVRNFLKKEPNDLDKKDAFILTIRYRQAGQIQEKEYNLHVIGRRGYSDYVLQMPDKPQLLYEISSVYIEDLLTPQKNFVVQQKPVR